MNSLFRKYGNNLKTAAPAFATAPCPLTESEDGLQATSGDCHPSGPGLVFGIKDDGATKAFAGAFGTKVLLIAQG